MSVMDRFSPRNPLYREIIKTVEFIAMYEDKPIKFADNGLYIFESSDIHSQGCWNHIGESEFWRVVEGVRFENEFKYIEVSEIYLVPVTEPIDTEQS